MSQQKAHQLLLLCVVSCVFVFFALLFLVPILGVLWGLLAVLFGLIFAIRRPDVWQREKAAWVQKLRRMKARIFSEGPSDDVALPAVYELVVMKPDTGRRYAVNKKTYLIGRGSHCDCRLSHADTIGRAHCRIVYREHSREYYIEDLRSKNGTYLGTRRLEPHTQVKLLENAEIFIGEYGLRFERQLKG